jgi:hypothetical protein
MRQRVNSSAFISTSRVEVNAELFTLCLIQKVDSRVEVNTELFTLCLIQKVDSRVEVNAELFTCLIQKVYCQLSE